MKYLCGIIITFLLFSSLAKAEEQLTYSSWLEQFIIKAEAKGHQPTRVRALLADLTPDDAVLERDRYQPEFTRPIWQYLDSAVSDLRVKGGKQALLDHQQLLQDLQNSTGVPAEIITAIWGLESAYGKIQGDFDVIRSLATLAHDGRRRNWAEGELLAAITMLDQGLVSRNEFKGAWAGAMGQTQFLPSTYLQYAVDGDGNGTKDIWNSEADALASTANYLRRHHWNADEDWGFEVNLTKNFPYYLAEDTVLSIGSWQVRGASLAEGRQWTKAELGDAARLLLPAGAKGPKILIGGNFRVIKRYNNSTSYALGVGLLARALVDKAGLRAAWPRDVKPLQRAQIKQMQELLKINGHDPGAADGISGPNTRRALRAYQQKIGLLADGFASQQMLENLKVSQIVP